MSEVTKSMVKTAADSTGFGLEFRAKEILETNQYKTNFNEDLVFNGISQQIDVLAWKTVCQELLIECKGSKKGSVLLLIKEPRMKSIDSNNIASLDVSGTDTKLINTYYEYSIPRTWLTFTGDFFHLKISGKNTILNQTPKSDFDSNFYKAQGQLSKAITINAKLNTQRKTGLPKDVMPILLTNSEIWVVDYEENMEIKYKWVLHRVSCFDEETEFYRNGDNIGWYILPIVNIEYFDDFLKCLEKNTETDSNFKVSLIEDGSIT